MLSSLRDQITSSFNFNELRNLCFDLNINYENLPGDTLDDKARELIEYCKRRGQMRSLEKRCQELRPHVSWVTEDIEKISSQETTYSAGVKYGIVQTPNPPKGFDKYRLGNIELPVMNLLGSPKTPFNLSEVIIEHEDLIHYQQPDYPAPLADAKDYLVGTYIKRFKGNWRNNPLPRFSGYRQSAETSENRRGRLTLSFSRTDFFTFLATNRSLDNKIIPVEYALGTTDYQTIREAYVNFPYKLEESFLANTLGAIIVVISRNLYQRPKDQVIIRFRGEKVALYQNCYQVSASGFMSLAHRDSNDLPNPFVTAVVEANEEIADRLQLEPADYRLIGIAVNWKDMDLNAYGYAETGQSTRGLLGDFRRDAYEGTVEAIPFEPKSVLQHIAQNKWEPVSVLTMCATLLAHFPRREVEAIARTLPAKHARDFDEIK